MARSRPRGSDSFDLTRNVNAGDWIAFKVYKRGDQDDDDTYFTQRIELTSH